MAPLDPGALASALQGSNIVEAMKAAVMAAKPELYPNPDVVITVHDNFWKPLGESHDFISTTFGFPRNKADTLKLMLKGNDPLCDIVLKCQKTLVPITAEVGYLRWAGWVDVALDQFKNKQYTVDVSAISLYAYLSRMVAWPAPELPIEIQFPNHGFDLGGAVTVIERLIEIQALRLQSGINELINNLGSLNFDFRAWFGTWLESNGDIFDMLRTPIYVVRSNPILDGSPFVSINWRMDKIDTLIEQTVKDNGLSVEVNLWKPGDPQPAANMLIDLHVPTYVVTVKDRSGRTGPGLGLFDGILKDFVDFEGSTTGDVLKPFLNPNNQFAPVGVNIAPALGINYVKPWVFFTDHPQGGLTEFEFAHHAPLAWQIISGGKSPKWACPPTGKPVGGQAHCAMNE